MATARLAKEANVKDFESQLLCAYRRLAPIFQNVVVKPNQFTTLDAFIEDCDAHAEVWEQMY